MKDIKKPSRNLRFNSASSKSAPTIKFGTSDARSISYNVSRDSSVVSARPISSRAHLSEIKHKVEEYETNEYDDSDVDVVYETDREERNGRIDQRENQRDARNYYNRPLGNKIINKKRKTSVFFWIKNHFKLFLFLVLTIGVGALLTFVFNSATVTITPKLVDKKIKGDYILTNTEEKKIFEVVKFEKIIEKDIPKNDKQKVVSKSEGQITIYNNFDSNPQKLIKNTRFESKEGKIFRISETVTVPGKTGNMPGKVFAKVTADSTGDTYNVPAGKWTIPGFKGSARYQGFYGESTSAMTGGSDGSKSVIAKEDIEAAKNLMMSEGEESIKSESDTSSKEGFYSLKDSIVYDSINNLEDFQSGKDTKFKMTITGKMLMIDKDLVASNIVKAEDSTYKNEKVEIKNFDELRFKYDTEKNKSTDLLTATSVYLTVEGLPTFIYKLDNYSLKMDLVGKENSDETFASVLSKYTSISSAKSKIFPMWVNKYPKNINKIKVIEE